jgi:hypothetical protein
MGRGGNDQKTAYKRHSAIVDNFIDRIGNCFYSGRILRLNAKLDDN